MRMNAIQIEGVSKRYGDVTALDNVHVTLESGRIYGLLGRNGAGKSTLLNIVANRIFADSGRVLVDGANACENMDMHEKLFCMSEADLYDSSLRVDALFKWINSFYSCFDLEEAYRIAEKFGLDTSKKFKALSKGYQTIFKLTVALALKVPYVFFDEPVLGLDANHRALFYELLLRHYDDGARTIVLATHLIEEVASLIEEVVLIDHGRLLLKESVADLLERGYCVSGAADAVDAYCAGKNVIGFDTLGGMKLAYVMGERAAAADGVRITGMNLQKLFVKLTEKEETTHEEAQHSHSL